MKARLHERALHVRTRLAWRVNAFETQVRYMLHLGSTVPCTVF